jgi:hypothetical protein
MELALQQGNTRCQKVNTPNLCHCAAIPRREQSSRCMLGYRDPAHDEPLEAGMTNARRMTAPAVSSRSILFGGFAAVCLAALGAAVLDSTGAANLKFAAAALPPSPKLPPSANAAELTPPAPIDNPVVIVEDVAAPPMDSAPAAIAEAAPAVESPEPVAE